MAKFQLSHRSGSNERFRPHRRLESRDLMIVLDNPFNEFRQTVDDSKTGSDKAGWGAFKWTVVARSIQHFIPNSPGYTVLDNWAFLGLFKHGPAV